MQINQRISKTKRKNKKEKEKWQKRRKNTYKEIKGKDKHADKDGG